jgi:RES domain-containing protein
VRIWRISNHADLSGRGGELAGGRWNRLGTPVVYCSDHPATALLEVLAHIDREDTPAGYQLIEIEIPDAAPRKVLGAEDLPPNWRNECETTQALGTELLERAEHLLIVVPCVLVPIAWNALLNSRHADIERCRVADTIKLHSTFG